MVIKTKILYHLCPLNGESVLIHTLGTRCNTKKITLLWLKSCFKKHVRVVSMKMMRCIRIINETTIYKSSTEELFLKFCLHRIDDKYIVWKMSSTKNCLDCKRENFGYAKSYCILNAFIIRFSHWVRAFCHYKKWYGRSYWSTKQAVDKSKWQHNFIMPETMLATIPVYATCSWVYTCTKSASTNFLLNLNFGLNNSI